MTALQEQWELLILDADSEINGLGCLTVADLYGDGHQNVVTGGNGAMLQHRPPHLKSVFTRRARSLRLMLNYPAWSTGRVDTAASSA